MDGRQLVEKYDDLTAPIMGEEHATEAGEAIETLESVSVEEFVAPFVEPANNQCPQTTDASS